MRGVDSMSHSIYLRLLLLWTRREGDWARRDLGLVTRPSLVAGILDGLICLVGSRLDEINSLVSMVDRNRREEEWNATDESVSVRRCSGPCTFWVYNGIGGFTSTTNMMLFSRSELGTQSFLLVLASVYDINMVVNILFVA